MTTALSEAEFNKRLLRILDRWRALWELLGADSFDGIEPRYREIGDHVASETKLALAAAPPPPVEVEPVACWVLMRNNYPYTVFCDEEKARADCERRRTAELMWREQNAHVADVRVYWNVDKAELVQPLYTHPAPSREGKLREALEKILDGVEDENCSIEDGVDGVILLPLYESEIRLARSALSEQGE